MKFKIGDVVVPGNKWKKEYPDSYNQERLMLMWEEDGNFYYYDGDMGYERRVRLEFFKLFNVKQL